jgi:hypothetical protein
MAFSPNEKAKEGRESVFMLYFGPAVGLFILLANKAYVLIF